MNTQSPDQSEPPDLKSFAERCRLVKQEVGKETLLGIVMGVRDGREILSAIPLYADNELLLKGALVLVTAMQADAVYTCMDTIQADAVYTCMTRGTKPLFERAAESLNPITGKPWRNGEMQQVAAQDRGVVRDWVRECLIITEARQASHPEASPRIRMIHQPYLVDPQGVVTWEEPRVIDNQDPGAMLTGRVVEMLVDMFTSIFQAQTYGGPGLDRESMDAAAVSVLSKSWLAVMVNPEVIPLEA